MNIPTGLKFEELKEWITDKRFGRLVVIGYDKKIKNAHRWKCICDCGKTCSRSTSNLRALKDHSCRCWGIEKCSISGLKHGMNNSSEYRAYTNMKSRCLNPKSPEFKRYGARGIKICNRWLESFENFIEDMGRKPEKNLTLDRIDSDGNYEPSNCRWASALVQGNNTRRNTVHVVDGIEATMAEHCRRTGMFVGTVIYRLKKGMTPKEAYKKVIY